MKKPRIAVTLGDPSGIGPETAAKASRRRDVLECAEVTLVGDTRFIKGRICPDVRVVEVKAPAGIKPAQPSRAAGLAALSSIKIAVELAENGEIDGIVTAPVSKISLKLAGSPHIGHTELLAALVGAPRAEMMMAAGNLRALILTRHIPLRAVAAAVSKENIVASARIYAGVFGKTSRLAVCAVNPHAGDGGLIGREEISEVRPAVAALRRMGFSVDGPLPADAAFVRAAAGEFDACLAMYHDQAMIPLKLAMPRGVVNVTLGLPFVRTSPGHGVAYDLAGRGRADENPTAEAIKFAARNCRLFRRSARLS